MQDLFASLLQDVCHDFEIEPDLQTLTGEILSSSTKSSDKARLDVSARGFWQRGQRAFFDERNFNPFVKSHLNQILNFEPFILYFYPELERDTLRLERDGTIVGDFNRANFYFEVTFSWTSL